MKKNGFVFVETIVAVVILTSSLLLLYSTFSKILQSEKTRVYYDDVNYIYRTWYVKERINSLNIMAALRDITSNTDKYFVTVGIEYDNLFTGYEREKTYISNLLEDYEVSQIIILKENKIDNLKKCTLECSLDSNCNDYENCNGLYTNLSDEMINYLKTIYIDVSCTYVMVIEYNTCSSDNTNCKSYYSWVSV
ncbi:MAG: hypothetical protein IJY87_05460 [Bacilli bacterium]|nr:hypothetical protein [Bacilli bacterium]MBQ8902487.1 hypothetical protein [Bacilli bacterium]